ncbi:hypothetical protein [Streptomyces arenae]|uniref:hypothetical protein n=1 Tax=Streptomyces arenae TaxID=29301 RepID=UPI002658FAB2|nr:hypothetical protein [Streptomyces arenae]MCG7206315.1 hypothetical protein [Streptomyces arenae]
MSRTVPGRRALQLALLVGGLLALGFLCGGRAQAAEGTTPATPSLSAATSVTTVTSTVGRELGVPEEPSAPHKRIPVVSGTPVAPVVDQTVRTATTTVAGTVRSATGTVVSVTGAVTQVVGDVVQQVSELQQTLPVVSTLPALPSLPQTASTLPVVQLPGSAEAPGETVPLPVTPAPGGDRPQAPAPHSAGDEKPHATADASATVSYGPRITFTAPAAADAAAHSRGHRGTRAVDAPSHPAPTGDPDGALGKSAVDGSAARHGDAHAVTLDGRAPLRLLPGAAAHVDAAETRDRYRDIPVFPG